MVLLVKNMPSSAGGLPWVGRSPGGRHGNPLQYSCLENPMDRGAFWAIVHRVEKNQIPLKQLSTHAYPLQKQIYLILFPLSWFVHYTFCFQFSLSLLFKVYQIFLIKIFKILYLPFFFPQGI